MLMKPASAVKLVEDNPPECFQFGEVGGRSRLEGYGEERF
jgi:hypothetical protein